MDEKKRVGAVISGGGRNGAFAVGALYYLMSEKGVEFDVVSGTSTGALIAGPAIRGDIELLNDIYRGGVCQSDVLDERVLPMALLQGAFNGIDPLVGLVRKYTDATALGHLWPKKKAVVTYVDMVLGEVRRCWSNNHAQWTDAVIASSVMPVLMDPWEIEGRMVGDGGLIDVIPFAPLLKEDPDRVFALVNFPEKPEPLEASPEGVLKKAARAVDIMTYEIARNDLEDGAWRLGNRLRVIRPDYELGDSLEFDPAEMTRIWQHGFDVAERVMTS